MKTILANLFRDILQTPSTYLQPNGEAFEKSFIQVFENIGFRNISTVDAKECLNKLKHISKNESKEIYKNVFSQLVNSFIYQPFGSQKTPDFLMFTEEYILPIEIKFKKSSTSPFWNSSYPKSNYIYIFGKLQTPDITCFLGADVLPDPIRELYREHIKLQKMQEKAFQADMRRLESRGDIINSRGWSVYHRNAFTQNRLSNPNAEMDFFAHSDRQRCESNVIELLQIADAYESPTQK